VCVHVVTDSSGGVIVAEWCVVLVMVAARCRCRCFCSVHVHEVDSGSSKTVKRMLVEPKKEF
jgi:hypothetical protein